MTPFDEYDEDGASRAQVWQREHRARMAAQRNYVPAQSAPLATRQPQTIDAPPAWLTQGQPLDVAAAWQPVAAAKESTSAVDRAKGLQLRLWPFLALYGAAGAVVGLGVWLVAGTLPGAALTAVLVFAALGVGTYIKLNVVDYDHSGAGVERLRITEAADLARTQLHHQHELCHLALETYLQTLERHEGRR